MEFEELTFSELREALKVLQPTLTESDLSLMILVIRAQIIMRRLGIAL